MTPKRRVIVPVFLPPCADRGAAIDPPPRAPCDDAGRWTARTRAACSNLSSMARVRLAMRHGST